MAEEPPARVSRADDIDAELARLASAAAGGDPRAFTQFVEKITPHLWRLALRLVDDKARADDVVQNTIVKLWRALPGLRDPRAARAFAFQTLRHVAIDDARAAARRRTTSLDAHSDEHAALAERIVADGPDAASTLESKEARALVRAAIDSLPEDDRLVILLCDVDGLSYDDAAVVLGTKNGTVASRLSRAREKLGKKLKAMAARERSLLPWRRP